MWAKLYPSSAIYLKEWHWIASLILNISHNSFWNILNICLGVDHNLCNKRSHLCGCLSLAWICNKVEHYHHYFYYDYSFYFQMIYYPLKWCSCDEWLLQIFLFFATKKKLIQILCLIVYKLKYAFKNMISNFKAWIIMNQNLRMI